MRVLLQFAVLAVFGSAFVAATPALADAHGASTAGVTGDPKQAARTVEIIMLEDANGIKFSPNRVEARRGEQVKFVFRNAGAISHKFFLGGKDENTSHGR